MNPTTTTVAESVAVEQRFTPTEHEKREWSRLAVAAYGEDRNGVGHRFSGAAALRRGESVTLARFDALQTVYRRWLVFGFDETDV